MYVTYLSAAHNTRNAQSVAELRLRYCALVKCPDRRKNKIRRRKKQ